MLNSQVWSINKLGTVSCSNFDLLNYLLRRGSMHNPYFVLVFHFGALEVFLKAQEAPGAVDVLSYLWEF